MLVAREARWPRVVLAACELGWPYIFEYIYRSFPVDVRIQCDVTQHMYFRFKVRYRVSFMLHMIIFRRLWETFLHYRWIMTKFLQCKCPQKQATILDSKSGCKSLPGRTPLEQQQNAELKFSVSKNRRQQETRSRETSLCPAKKPSTRDRGELKFLSELACSLQLDLYWGSVFASRLSQNQSFQCSLFLCELNFKR